MCLLNSTCSATTCTAPHLSAAVHDAVHHLRPPSLSRALKNCQHTQADVIVPRHRVPPPAHERDAHERIPVNVRGRAGAAHTVAAQVDPFEAQTLKPGFLRGSRFETKSSSPRRGNQKVGGSNPGAVSSFAKRYGCTGSQRVHSPTMLADPASRPGLHPYSSSVL
jgi:hypothetical protein